jgi:hypothetical protein
MLVLNRSLLNMDSGTQILRTKFIRTGSGWDSAISRDVRFPCLALYIVRFGASHHYWVCPEGSFLLVQSGRNVNLTRILCSGL